MDPASVSRCQARVSSLRATAVVAIFFPRRWAMRWKVAANCGCRLAVWAASHSTQRSPTEPSFPDVPVVGDAVAAADGGGEPGPGRQLARRGEPAHVADLGEDDQRGERPYSRELGKDPDPRVGPGALADLAAGPVDGDLQRTGQRQVVIDHLAGGGGQLERGEPFPARSAPGTRRGGRG